MTTRAACRLASFICYDGKIPRTQLARFFCNLFKQVARSTPLAMQSSYRLIAASMHNRFGSGKEAPAFFADFLADFFEVFFALRLVAIRSDSLEYMSEFRNYCGLRHGRSIPG